MFLPYTLSTSKISRQNSPGSIYSILHFPNDDERDSQVEVKRIGVIVGNVEIGVSHLSKAYHMTE